MSHEPLVELAPGLTDAEIKGVQRSNKGRAIYAAAKQMAKQMQFEVGDVLVLRDSRDKLKMMHGEIAQKWKVVYKCEAGLVYAKKILAGGRMGIGVDLIATYHDSATFELDPDMADAVLTGQEADYKPEAEAKNLQRKKDKQRRLNKALKLHFSNLVDAENKIKEYKVGDKIYRASTLTDTDHDEYEVTSIETKKIDHSSSYRYHDEEYKKIGMTEKTVLKVKFNVTTRKSTYTNYNRDIEANELTRHYHNWFVSRPWHTDEVLVK